MTAEAVGAGPGVTGQVRAGEVPQHPRSLQAVVVASILDADTWPPLLALFVLMAYILAEFFEPTPRQLLLRCIPAALALTGVLAILGFALDVL